ncbi:MULTISPECIES: bifunctional proline dehydrogenase/L-glutamate gamma-semialdehyde dehydrogenase [Rothia]|uniref:L-glutamate gamma-semialdehyde dehydrogenase n=1 Tax=Rothia nasimurium TaxID=85336 RepID=A0A1Y1RQ07_9MICC|nr:MULTISPECIES: bifunctional proline dehydrogenase/L-glutamate gamma-semialdehyde dehydrogenase [Rothia]ORC18939.1 1-pyrroline-5-carboxylate dehydrogenase [Rothia nasimurium]
MAQPFSDPHHQQLAEQAVNLVADWVKAAQSVPSDPAAEKLAGVLKDPNGLDFTVGFVDGVVRPEDQQVAGQNLSRIAPIVPSFLPWYMKSAVGLGGKLAAKASWPTVPVARAVLRQMVGHLIVDARDEKLGPAIKHLTSTGNKLNINLLGEAVLGDREAERRLSETKRLLTRDDVDYVSIKVSSVSGPHSHWAFEEVVDEAVRRLTPLYELAANSPAKKFINLDMEEYKDLDMTIEVFTKILDQPHLKNLEAGIVLQAYLPDTLAAMQHLQEWAATRVADGGAPIKVRLVKGANLSMEKVEAAVHGWPLTTCDSKQDSDTNYKRILNYALTPEHTKNIRLGVAGHNLFDVAFALLLAEDRGVEKDIEFEMLIGMASQQAEVIRRRVGHLLLYTPVVRPEEFDVAISYLVRRLEENASSENFMSAVFDLDSSPELFEREKNRFLRSLEAVTDEVQPAQRTQNRLEETAETVFKPASGRFENTPDTDPALAANREWGRAILERSKNTQIGIEALAANELGSVEDAEALVAQTASAGESWGARPAAERAEILRQVAVNLAVRRADFMEIMAHEAGKTLEQGDIEVSEAVDFAYYYAMLAERLNSVDGAAHHPVKLTLVVPPWNFPTAIPVGGVIAALAAGSGVIFKPASNTARVGALIAEVLWEAGVPRDVLRLVKVTNRDAGSRMIAHPAVDRLILTGGYETAEMFRSWRKDLPLFGETSGKNSIIVTPNADFDLAVKDIVYSAFGHAGQKCSAASTVILVGSVGESKRFYNQLVDAVKSLYVAHPQDIESEMGPVIEKPEGKLKRGLTTLGDGETWIIKPEQLDETGRLWSPGVRAGVKPGSEYHLTEYFGPILGIMKATTLEEAIELQNATDYGLTAGLHSLDSQELELWLSKVQAGNLYANRGITGAIVQRQPFGGWKKSTVGSGTKAGGPNYLVALSDWSSAEATASTAPSNPSVRALLAALREPTATQDGSLDMLTRSASSDAEAWASEFGVGHDPSQLGVERNILRYLPTTVQVRLDESGDRDRALRVLLAGLAAGATIEFTTGQSIPVAVAGALRSAGVTVLEQSDETYRASLATIAKTPSKQLEGTALEGARIRYIGDDATSIYKALGGRPDIAVYFQPVTEAGRIEMLPFIREQAVSITAHRFGNPYKYSECVI